MAKVFREWSVNQRWLLPPSVMELVPEGHLAHFLRETVRESLDLSAVLESYDEERGKPPYHPVMMTAVLLYVPRAESSRPQTATCRATTRSSRSTARIK